MAENEMGPCADGRPQVGERVLTGGMTVIGAALLLPGVMPVAHAENPPEQGQISFKYLYYKDWEQASDRIKVNAPSLGFLFPIGENWSLEGSVVNDAVSGPTPRAYSISTIGASSRMSDNRKQGDFKVTRYFPRAAIGVGVAYSTENDYISRAISTDVRWSTENNNTTFNAGVGYSNDKIPDNNGKITTFPPGVTTERKRSLELGFGVTQVLTPNDIGQINITYSQGKGFFSDPYKQYDVRPDNRNQTAILFRWNHYVASMDASLRASYRYYRDNFIGLAHTFGLEWEQPVGSRYVLTPGIRFHTQNAAGFYVDPLPGATPGTWTINPALFNQPYHSLDQRLSAFGAITLSLKAEMRVTKDWNADFKVENYEQRSDWRLGGSGSPGISPFYARFYQFGVTKKF
ncbi:MAG: DUF3570 domain-containing protein [Betaproteobacteria bacterium]|nr:DUF3570 domain-containing protein [Betaproteobacteria bacterium]MDE2048372.1 DUF3570 domain-containing protein [Betaproteobacteria bacterium]